MHVPPVDVKFWRYQANLLICMCTIVTRIQYTDAATLLLDTSHRAVDLLFIFSSAECGCWTRPGRTAYEGNTNSCLCFPQVYYDLV